MFEPTNHIFMLSSCLLMTGAALAQPSADPTVPEVVTGIQSWQASLNQFEVEFTTKHYEVDHDEDPFDEGAWRPRSKAPDFCTDYRGKLRLLAPESYWVEYYRDCEFVSGHGLFSWHDNQMRTVANPYTESDRVRLGTIHPDYNYDGTAAVTRMLQPFGYRFLGRNTTLSAYLVGLDPQACELTVDDGMVTLHYTIANEYADETLEITVDPARRYHPQEISHITQFTESDRIIKFVYRYLEIQPFEKTFLPKRTVLVHYAPFNIPEQNIKQEDYFVTDVHMQAVRRDRTISATNIEVVFPSGTLVNDFVIGERWTAGVKGVKTNRQDMPGLRIMVEEQKERMRVSMEGQQAAAKLKASQRSNFPYITISVCAGALAMVIYFARRFKS